MSLSFFPGRRVTVAHVVTCGCPAATERAPRYGAWVDADAEAARASAAAGREPLPGCEMPDICPQYPLHAEEIDADGPAPEVNTHNGTARLLLPLLELSVTDEDGQGDPYGTLPAPDFLGRVLTALALTPPDPGARGRAGRFSTGGRAPGHLQRRLHDLHHLAQWCQQHDRPVTWG
ncbi:hypothetical protein [Streptomyces qinglanensis]|uniref:hypothetical protein n=1 Tax=Streptomyces qinglanensis TaxID=943816 RepID=UPI003D72D175